VTTILAAIAIPAYNGYIKQSKISSLVENFENGFRLAKGEAAKIAAGGICVSVITQLNDGAKKAIGDPANVAYAVSGTVAGQVTVADAGGTVGTANDGCPEPGETVTVALTAVAGTGSQGVIGNS
jgi:Tfp pilus assembly protein FimT